MGRSTSLLLQIAAASATAGSTSAARHLRFRNRHPSCRTQLSAIAESFGGAGGSGTVNVTAREHVHLDRVQQCPLDFDHRQERADNGNGTVSFSVQPNTGPARNGILTIGGPEVHGHAAAGSVQLLDLPGRPVVRLRRADKAP